MNRLAPFALLLSVAFPAAAAAADPPDRLVLPLSDPARPARLEVAVMMGSVTVVPGKAGEVVVHVSAIRASRRLRRPRRCRARTGPSPRIARSGAPA